jgi:DNA invertase Pin-like site-specific DNA recombinase
MGSSLSKRVPGFPPDESCGRMGDPPEASAKRAAQYIRMSTDAQDLSPEIQSNAIAEYARTNGITIVETYFDAGRSGLTLQRRPAMKKLLNDVTLEHRSFAEVLVYDISRWGRFQDTDASAYYEYHCRMHGVQIRYVQELFPPSDTPLGNVLKNLKRAMAAEYSRELAVKTRAGQKAAIDAGFHIGGLPCLGIGRVAVSKHDGAQRTLGPKDHKAATREHVKWIRGPDEEVALVQRIFHLYTTTGISIFKLGRLLQSEGITTATGKPLTPWMLYSLFSCEALVGNFVWGREDHGRAREAADPSFWRVSGCIEPVISPETWEAAQTKRGKRAGTVRSRGELLAFLADAVSRDPQFNASDLKACNGPSRETYRKHFGSFAAALACLGLLPPKRSDEEFHHLRKACALGRSFRALLETTLKEHGLQCRALRRQGHLVLINEAARVRIQVIWRAERHGLLQWSLRKVYREPFDYVFLVRLKADDCAYDSLLLRRDEYFRFPLWFSDDVPGPDFLRLWTERGIADMFRPLDAISVTARSRSEAGLLGHARRSGEAALPLALSPGTL